MLWQCRCCGFMTPDHLRISSHMKEMHDIKFKPDIIMPLTEEEKERNGDFGRRLFSTDSDMVRYSAPTEE